MAPSRRIEFGTASDDRKSSPMNARSAGRSMSNPALARWAPAVALAAVVAVAGMAFAAAAQAQQIYSCTDASGKKLTSDRPITECNAREQRVLRPDGSVRQVVPPTPTASERAEIDARERDAAAERANRLDAVRRDRMLLSRYPNEAAHRKARNAALDDIGKALQMSQNRLAALAAERKPLKDEAEFYVGKPLPMKLKIQLDANDASTDAQHTLMQNQRLESVRINRLYDTEFDRLKKLWAGAQPGTIGVAQGPTASAPRRP
jgi:Domain of unknown function (DUF4124)